MPDSEKITIYDASNRDRIDLVAWRNMVKELYDYRELIFRLTKRNVAAQYRQSFLGMLWLAFPPIATTVVFALLRQAEIVQIPLEGIRMPYALFVLIGVTIWSTFTQIVLAATGSVSAGGALVSKVYFPREVLVLSAVGGALVGALIRAAVVFISFIAFGFVPAWQIIWVPIALMPMLLFAVGLGLLFAPIHSVVHDTARILDFLFQFGMFLAPTIYPTPSLEDAVTHWQIALFWLHRINPVSYSIDAARALIDHGSFDLAQGFWISVVVSIMVMMLGWRFFHITEPLVAERL